MTNTGTENPNTANAMMRRSIQVPAFQAADHPDRHRDRHRKAEREGHQRPGSARCAARSWWRPAGW